MRTVLYGVFNKETNERIFTHCLPRKAQEFLESLENKENFEIRHKWVSI